MPGLNLGCLRSDKFRGAIDRIYAVLTCGACQGMESAAST